ncbi:MAG: nucleotidyltransferase [Chthoniobacteraceae bacterium]
MEPHDQLLRVCSLLNERGARYLIVGGHACILHGHVRTTEDVDVLVEDSLENFQRVIDALSALEDHAAAELKPQDIAENVVVKIADEVEVDVSRQAWQVRYADAIATAEAVTIDGVRVPFVSLEMLIKSKTTYREQDRADLVRLRDLLEMKRRRRDLEK